MKIKVKFLNKILVNSYFGILAIVSTLFSLFSVTIDIPNKYKVYVALILLIFIIIIYIALWIKANYLQSKIIKIGNSTVEIKVGNIFDEKALKVIAFNEYFDSIVDNKIISETTLNGKYIKHFVDDVSELDLAIDNCSDLKDKILGKNENRESGKIIKYKLGTIFKNNDYLLTAFSKFDENNRAYLNISDYINFLLNFWNEIDIHYAGKSVSIPILGSGITRFKGYENISDQELLELLIWSFKVSRIKFTYPSKVTILINNEKIDKINFYQLKGE